MINIVPNYCCFLKDKIWFNTTTKDLNLYAIDIQTGVVDIPLYPWQSLCSKAYSNILAYHNKLVFVPCVDKRICILDIDKNLSSYQDIPVNYPVTDNKFLFLNGIIYKDKLYLFGYFFRGILKYDLNDKNFEIIDDWINDITEYYSADGFFHVKYYKEESKVYYPFMNTNAVLELDLSLDRSRVHKVGSEGQRYISIEKIEDKFYLIPRDGRNGKLVEWNPEDGSYIEYGDFPEGFNHHQYAFYRSAVVDNQLIMFAHAGNMNVVFDPHTCEMKKYVDLYDSEDVPSAKYSAMIYQDGSYLFLTPKGLINWDIKNKTVIEKPYLASIAIANRLRLEESKRIYRTTYLKKGGNNKLVESKDLNLQSFLLYISNE